MIKNPDRDHLMIKTLDRDHQMIKTADCDHQMIKTLDCCHEMNKTPYATGKYLQAVLNTPSLWPLVLSTGRLPLSVSLRVIKLSPLLQ